jgi:histone H3/H4
MPPKQSRKRNANGREPKYLQNGRPNPKYVPRKRQFQKFDENKNANPEYYRGFHGLKDSYIQKICHRASIKRISADLYSAIRQLAKLYTDAVLNQAIIYAEHAKRSTVLAIDIVFAVRYVKTNLSALYSGGS